MAQFFTDWREYAADAAPHDWSQLWHANLRLTVLEDPDSLSGSGKKLQFSKASGSPIFGAAWNAVPESDVQEVLALINLDPNPPFAGQQDWRFGVAACVSGTTTDDGQAYIAVFHRDAAPPLTLQRYTGGSQTDQIGSGPGFSLPNRTTPVWIRLRVDDQGVRCRAWAFGDPEPDTWHLTAADTTFRGGRPGLFLYNGNSGASASFVHRFGASTDGDPALGSFPPSAPALPFPHDGAIVKGIVAVPIGAAIDPDGDPLQYEIDISEDGGQSFVPLFALSPELVRMWDVSSRPLGPNRQLRARAFDGINYGPYAFSGVFTTTENSIPERPSVTAEVLGRGTVRLTGSAFVDADEGDIHIATRYRILDASGAEKVSVVVNNPVELTTKVFGGLQAGQYIGEMVYLSSDGTESPPGVAVFTLQGVTQINWTDCDDA